MPQSQADPETPGRSWAFVVLALICSALAYTDRQFVSLIVGPLEQALNIDDTRMGLAQGLAFSLCYAVAGLPLAFALDKGKRVGIAAGCMAVWSLATGASGLAVAFIPFLATRAATAFAEAGFSPAVLSMIADRFPRRRIPAATAIYLIAPPVGTAAALTIGGALLQVFGKRGGLTLPVVGHLEPWQAVFVTLMTPGLMLAVIFTLAIKEPIRRDVRRHRGMLGASPSTLKAELSADGGLLLIYMTAIALVMVSTFALSAWAPTLFIRRFGLPMHQAGAVLGPIFLVTSLAGAVISSLLSRRADDKAILARVLAIILTSASLLAPCIVGMCLSPSYPAALAFYGLSGLTAGVATSLATTPMQLSTSHQARAQTIAVGGFLLAVIGAGGGPFLVGLLTDHLFGDTGAVGKALALTALASSALGLPLIFMTWRRARTIALADTDMAL